MGIHTALRNAGNPVVLVVAGDLPLLKKEVLHLLIEKFFTNDCDAVVPIVNGYMEPLVAVYARSNLAIIEENIHSQRLKIVDFIRRVHTETLSEREIRTVDPELCSFMNINTRADYYELVRRGHGPSPNPEGESQLS